MGIIDFIGMMALSVGLVLGLMAISITVARVLFGQPEVLPATLKKQLDDEFMEK